MEKYIQPFVDVCVSVFRDLAGCDVIAGRAFFIEKESPADWDISAVIGLTGEARGAVVISMKKELALRLTTMLTGSEHTEIDTETLDAVGEIVNIIAGNAKKNLEESFALVISLPTIIKGVDHVVAWPSGEEARIICIPFKLLPSSMTEDTFYLSVAIEAAGGK